MIVVNEDLARRYWPERQAVGATVQLGGPGGFSAEVIGVAKDGKYGNIAESPQPVIYVPLSQKINSSLAMTMVVRATRPAVLLMVLAQAAGMVGTGLAAGAGLAFGLMPAFAFAFNFAPRDGMVLTAVSLGVAATAFIASWLSARRAAALNPVVALRED